MRIEEAKIVAIGGGTGLSTMLRGLKKHTQHITAIVTVADNGGGSGVLRQEMNMLPPGDIRNCILALSNTEPIMEKLLQYRFKKGYLAGQSFGNLFLAAMNDVTGSFEEAVKNMSEVLAITGKVLPVTAEDVQLCAMLEDGTVICGETEIVSINKVLQKKIQRVYLMPEMPAPSEEALAAIREADAILLGPGSLFSSIIPNLLVDGIAQAIREAEAKTIYISNIMTQPGETDNFSLSGHIEALEQYLGAGVIDHIITNKQKVPPYVVQLYKEEDAYPIVNDYENLGHGLRITAANLVKLNREKHLIRHDSDKLGMVIKKVVQGDEEEDNQVLETMGALSVNDLYLN